MDDKKIEELVKKAVERDRERMIQEAVEKVRRCEVDLIVAQRELENLKKLLRDLL